MYCKINLEVVTICKASPKKRCITKMSDYFDELGCEPTGAEGPGEEAFENHMKRLRVLAILHGIDIEIEVPPASKEAIKRLNDHVVTKAEEESGEIECAICKKACEENEIYKILPCKHKFHEECVLLWLKKSNSCPMCRHELETDDPQYEEVRKFKADETDRRQRMEDLHGSMFS